MHRLLEVVRPAKHRHSESPWRERLARGVTRDFGFRAFRLFVLWAGFFAARHVGWPGVFAFGALVASTETLSALRRRRATGAP